MEKIVLVVFGLTYVGMALGRVPGLRLDRAGIGLLAAVALLAVGAMGVEDIGRAIDLPTLLLLFALMIISSQFGAAGFYDWVASKLAGAAGPPSRLLLLVVIVAGLLSAVLANDIIAFAMAPILALGTRRRGLDPRPFLIALAGACNAGSAMTVIGNPQNILIGQAGGLDFWRFLAVGAPAGLFAIVVVFAVVAWQWRNELRNVPTPSDTVAVKVDWGQTIKGAIAIVALIVLFATPLPRDIGALVIAAALLISRRTSSHEMIGSVDWNLLLLFTCLFIVTAAFSSLGLAADGIAWLNSHGLLPDRLVVMAPLLAAMSNAIGNVPSIILILSVWPHPPEGAMYAMAILSTLAGNLLIVGSLANIIVAERANAVGVRLGFIDHAKSGVPIALVSMAGAVVWLWQSGWMPLD